MPPTQAIAFLNALADIEGLDGTPPFTPFLDDSMHFGVFSGTGDPLASSTINPNAKYRALLSVGEIPKFQSSDKPSYADDDKSAEVEIYTSGDFGSFTEKTTTKRENYFACGVQVHYQNVDQKYRQASCFWGKCGPKIYLHDDDQGIVKIEFMYCKLTDWNKKSPFESIGSSRLVSDMKLPKSKICPTNYFIDGMRVRACTSDNPQCSDKDGFFPSYLIKDNLGVHGISISCNKLGGSLNDRKFIEVHCSPGYGSCSNGWERWEYLNDLTHNNTEDSRKLIVGGSTQLGITGGIDSEGINAIMLLTEDVPVPNDNNAAEEPSDEPLVDIITYYAVWKGKVDRPTAIFASTIRVSLF